MNPEIEKKLRPWQIEPANRLYDILQKHGSALDCSDTGVGKTYVALAVAKALQLPTLAIVPKIAISGWLAVAEHFNEGLSICGYEKLRTGRTVYGTWANHAKGNSGGRAFYVCLFCQRRYMEGNIDTLCTAHSEGVHCLERKRRPTPLGDFRFSPAVKLIVWDECQRTSGLASLNSKMLIACKRQKIKHLLLSATPFDTVLKAKAIGYSLDLFTL